WAGCRSSASTNGQPSAALSARPTVVLPAPAAPMMMITTPMTVIEISEPGDPGVLRPAERPMPVPGRDEVLIKVAAAGVNRPDVAQRLGRYPPPPGASDIPGLEIAGTIDQTGAGVREW